MKVVNTELVKWATELTNKVTDLERKVEMLIALTGALGALVTGEHDGKKVYDAVMKKLRDEL